jgi:hypothetical protein
LKIENYCRFINSLVFFPLGTNWPSAAGRFVPEETKASGIIPMKQLKILKTLQFQQHSCNSEAWFPVCQYHSIRWEEKRRKKMNWQMTGLLDGIFEF